MKGFSLLVAFALVGTISQVFAVTSCTCNGAASPLYGDMCVCGCKAIKNAYAVYTKKCPTTTLSRLDADFASKCSAVENTEDCEYFKSLPEDITNLYKDCRDKLDSIKDDCEECNAGANSCKY